MKAKTKTVILISLGLIFVLSPIISTSLSFITGNSNRNSVHREDITLDNENVVPPLTASTSVVYEWNRTWGGVDWDRGYGVGVDSLGNVYLTGSTESFGAGSGDMVLVKYDTSGVQQWNRTWGGTDYDSGSEVAVDLSDNVYVSGRTSSFGAGNYDMLLVKYDGSGVQQWNRTWGGGSNELGMGVAVDLSDNVYVAGTTLSFGVGLIDMVVVKYDSSGVQQWNRTWGGSLYDEGTGVVVDSSGNVYLAGTTESFAAGPNDMVLVKYDSSGVQQWNRTWGGSLYDYCRGVGMDSSGNVYLSGFTGTYPGSMALVKYDSSGVQQWNRTWGGTGYDSGNGVAIDSLGDIYIAGTTSSYGARSDDLVLVTYDGNGVLQSYYTWGGGNLDEGKGVAVDSSGNVYLAGYITSFGAGNHDMVLVKYDPDVYDPEIAINSLWQNDLFGKIAPNFDISIIEPNLDTTWYTLDGGITNYTFSGLTGTIDQTEWNKKENGTVTIRFYANDTAGNVGYAEVSIFKDIDDPEIIINDPTPDQVFEDNAPTYDISVVEPNLDSIWYTIDGGVNNYTITLLSSTINQEAWDDAPYGDINIRFYAEDLAGNIDYSEVSVEKIEKGVPGYDLLVLICLIGIITIIYRKKFSIKISN